MLLNISKIEEYKTELETYDDIIPMLLMDYINNGKYINNLKKNNLFYNNVQERIFDRRRVIQFLSDDDLIEYGIEELLNWLKENPKYKDVVNQL